MVASLDNSRAAFSEPGAEHDGFLPKNGFIKDCFCQRPPVDRQAKSIAGDERSVSRCASRNSANHPTFAGNQPFPEGGGPSTSVRRLSPGKRSVTWITNYPKASSGRGS